MPELNEHNSSPEERNGIGTLNEHSLHADLIAALSQPEDQLEAEVQGYVADILRGDKIIEVQTRNLGALRKKLNAFSPEYQVTVVHPITLNKWIVRKNSDGEVVSRRKSPKRGRVEEIFTELVRARDLISSPNVKLEILLIDAEEVWLDDGQGSWRRKFWSISERHLQKIHSSVRFESNLDFLDLLPKNLPTEFTNKDIAASLGVRSSLAGKISYTLRKMDLIQIVGKSGNQYQFIIKKDV